MSETFNKPRILPLAWLILALIAGFALHRYCPIVTLIPGPFHWAGLAFTVPGLALLLHAGVSFIKAKTGLLPFSDATSLVTDDFYRFSRNPMYLGMVLLLFGVATVLGSLSALFPVVAFAWIIDRQFIRNEEAFLLEKFGEEYQAYMRRVRRWF